MITKRRSGGFTLLEAMIALVVLLVALVGALAGLISASQEFRAGQLRQAEMVLVEAKSQRLMLMDHVSGPTGWPPALQWSSAPVINTTWVYPTGPESFMPGVAPWVVDPDPPTCPARPLDSPPKPDCTAAGGTNGPLDLSVGAYFVITGDGTIWPDLSVLPGTPCNDPAIPKETFCRELVIGQGVENTDPGGLLAAQALPLNHTGYTIWIRVTRNGKQAAGGDVFWTDPATGAVTSVGTVLSHDTWVN